jgi:hypothetical protein
MRLVFTVPDCRRKGIFLSDSIFVDWTKRSTTEQFGLVVMSVEPQRLQPSMG